MKKLTMKNMKMNALGLAIIASVFAFPLHAAMQRYQLVDSVKIDNVWSGHPVDFAFVERGDSQYVAYYDSSQKMTVALRTVASKTVQKKTLSSKVGWDSHNSIAMALDSAGYIHVSGNMHAVPLVYFRSSMPYKIDSIKAASMVGTTESSVTYPVFIMGPSQQLLFMYRDGTSGNGNQIFNSWNHTTKKWSRLFNSALISGEGQRNAYMGGPFLGPDGYYHIYWMWRETGDAGSTHDVSYIKSKDLITWENAAGTKLSLPITMSSPGVIVETIAEKSGLINRGAIGFDAQKRLILTYHRYDNTSNHYTQIYNARREGSAWKIYQTSDWNYQWVIGGSGTLILQVTFGPVVLEPNGSLTQSFYHAKNGTGVWELDPATLKPKGSSLSSLWPQAMEGSTRSGMVVHWLKSQGVVTAAGTFSNSTSSPSKDSSIVYALRWETMPENQDQPRSVTPAPTSLMLYTFKDPNVISLNANPQSKEYRVSNNQQALFVVKKGNILCDGLPGQAFIKIFSATGVLVKSKSIINDGALSYSDLPRGIYFVSLASKTMSVRFEKKMIVVSQGVN